MQTIRLGINTTFAQRRWERPKQWMEIIHSNLELDICELSLDLIDPNLREPTKTAYLQEILELGDDYQIELLSCCPGISKNNHDMLLHPNFGYRIQAIQWIENAIDIAAYTRARYFGGYFGGLIVQEHTDSTLLDYAVFFLIDSMTYISSVAYAAGLNGMYFEPFSFFPETNKTIDLNLQILQKIQNSSSLPIYLSPSSHHAKWIPKLQEKFHIAHIRHPSEAEQVHLQLNNSRVSNEPVNIVLNWIPSINDTRDMVLNKLEKIVEDVKTTLKLE
ncbi:MAG: hypothetical protein JW776_06945 [Candidatus Lokiarchaeota archaeon]|nr:hypothetical protein [Candidatus Lokiarchaeota archaeon]